ncbi:MAG: MarR family winged helix-turn-helix transcriptional regulator [Nitrospira sp.]|nr:MarR family winged helix-turn-helix transcriptional regulator [Nitrospira sp.]MCP9464428.1 MarR family winged helix-turn-helix transcriptional regulator [Nitrospira sp.]
MVPPAEMKQDPLPDRLVMGLSKISLAMKSRTWRRQGRKGVGPLQMQVLTYLKSCPGQAATISTIARELAVKLPTASEVIRTLADKGLVRRRQSETDQRVVKVCLTAKGAKAGTTESAWPELLAAATTQLTPQEQINLLTALVKMIYGLQQQGEIPVARMCVSCAHFQPNEHKGTAQPHHCRLFDAPFGDQALRLDCPEYVSAQATRAKEA